MRQGSPITHDSVSSLIANYIINTWKWIKRINCMTRINILFFKITTWNFTIVGKYNGSIVPALSTNLKCFKSYKHFTCERPIYEAFFFVYKTITKNNNWDLASLLKSIWRNN